MINKEKITKQKFKIIDMFKDDDKVKVTVQLNKLLELQKKAIIKQIEINIFEI